MALAVDMADKLITINITMDAPPAGSAGFGTLLVASPDCAPASGLVRSYASTADIDTDIGSAVLTDVLGAKLKVAFAQSPRPSIIKCAKVDAAPMAATIAADLADIKDEDDDWYGLTVDTETEANVAAKIATLTPVATWAESERKIHIIQTEDPDTYGVAATDMASVIKTAARERSLCIFAALDGTPNEQAAAIALGAGVLAVDPDVQSAPWSRPVAGVLAAGLTNAQIDAVWGKNGNVTELYGGVACFVSKGTNGVNRQVHEIVSKDWLEARVRSDMATLATTLAARGEKFPLNASGVALCASVINKRLEQGSRGVSPHFDDFDQATGSANTTTKTITMAARAKILGNAVEFVFNIGFTNEDL